MVKYFIKFRICNKSTLSFAMLCCVSQCRETLSGGQGGGRGVGGVEGTVLFVSFQLPLGDTWVIQDSPLATEPGIEDIATKFEQEYVRCVRNEEECVCSVCLQCD